jgi:hypothetical protein
MPDWDESDLDFEVEIKHEFEIELNRLVVLNHQMVLDALAREEKDASTELQEDLADDYEALSSAISHMRKDYDDLRNAANELALVGLLTRFQHWIHRYVQQLKRKGQPGNWLVKRLTFLNQELESGPIPTSDFEELLNVRDSIIHADSQAEWMYENKARKVVDRFRRNENIEFTEVDLQEAIEKCIKQVSYYDHRLRELPNQESPP